jgi:SAM-dependent methyltransferase
MKLNNVKKKIKSFLQPQKKFDLFEYKDKEGNFDYQLYKEIQDAGNKRKIDWSWATEEDMTFLAKEIKDRVQELVFGICHGTRQGLEQKWLSDSLNNIEVIGTDIAESATDFPNTIQWDFHEEKPEWGGKADFVYSNSFDHSYDPKKSLNAWMKTLKPGGICILQHSKDHSPDSVNELDPFGAALEILPYLILEWGEGKFSVREIIESPNLRANSDGEFKTTFVIIKNNE